MNRRSLLRSLAPVALLAASTPHAQHAVAPWPPAQALPAVEAVDLQGRPWRLADLRGRPVLLNFWASWCEPCRAEMPTLQALAELYGPEQLAVVALNFKEAPATVARFVQRTGVRLRVVLDRDGAIARACAVKVFPTTLLIGADGRPRQRLLGELDWTGAEAERLVQELLAAPGR
nr:TlpA disulfide reductase family protein [Variovorax boronicumulans]